MYSPLSRLIQALILPPASLLLQVIAGLVIIRRHRASGRLLIASGLAFLYLFSIGPVSEALVAPLEREFPLHQTKGYPPVQAIVVLSGGVRDVSWSGTGPERSEASIERLVKGVTIYRERRIPLFSRGGGGPREKHR